MGKVRIYEVERERERRRAYRARLLNDPVRLEAARARSRVRFHASDAASIRRKKLATDPDLAARARTWRKEHKRKIRAANLAAGFTTKGTRRRDPSGLLGPSRRAEREAVKAWQHWLRERSPLVWRRKYHRVRCRLLGKPWNNPMISAAKKWRIRYWLDEEFRAAQYEKIQTVKTKRRREIKETCDGTLSGLAIVRMLSAARDCRYCGKRMIRTEKNLDHTVPLTRGGAHSVRNVVVCCKTCNFTKARRTLDEWLCLLPRRHHQTAPGATLTSLARGPLGS